MDKGYLQVYTGDGKGKTTAALGLALRAAGAGLNVLWAQFVKEGEYSEITSLKKFENQITIKQFGTPQFIMNKPSAQDKERALSGLKEIAMDLTSGQYDVVILDEANVAVDLDLFSIEQLLEYIENRQKQTEVIITGRNAHPLLLKVADLVTEMKEIKHYYDQGVDGRLGIES